MIQDYFSDYTKGESYSYGLKCVSPEFVDDSREVVVLNNNEVRNISIAHDSNSRKFLQVHLSSDAKVNVELVLVAKEGIVVDSFIEVLHKGDRSESQLTIRGYTEGNGRVICRVRTNIPHNVHNAKANQNIRLHQFDADGITDCIPVLEVQNKTTTSSHSVRLERISETEYWSAERLGMNKEIYNSLKKSGLQT